MSLTKKSFLIFTLALLLIAPTLAVTAQSNSDSGGSQQKTVLATVNGSSITKRELSQNAQIYPIIMTLSRQFRKFGQFLMSSEAGQNFLEEYKKYVLDDMINQEIQKQKIEELGVTVSEEDVQQQIDQIIEQNKQFKDEQSLKDYLKKNQKMSLEDLKSRIRESLKSKKLREEVTNDVTVTEEEINSYYEKNKKSFTDDEGNVKPLEDVKSQIESTIEGRKRNQKFQSWLKQAREEAEIEKSMDKI